MGHIAGRCRVHVRVGAANAGHTVYVGANKHVLQQLPCAAYANPYAKLVLGAGAMISRDILAAEASANIQWRQDRGLPSLRLYIDHRAHVVQQHHKELECEDDLAHRIGSTSSIAGEGIGPAQALRVLRRGYLTADQMDAGLPGHVCDTVQMLHDAMLFGEHIMLEGTQGTGLSNITGFYPYVTSRNPTAAGLAADVGVGPRDLDTVIMVCRTYPIRVAGNSGPFWPGSREVAWHDLGIDQEKERTTVTGKIRRVATFSYDQVVQAARINSATEIALTFADYVCPELANQTGIANAQRIDEYDYVGPMVREIERRTGVPVTLIGTGPRTVLNREPELSAQSART